MSSPMAPDQEKLNEMYTRLQMIDSQLKQVQAQMNMVEQELETTALVKEALTDLDKVPSGNEILVPIAGGIFVKASIQDPQSLLVNVGSSVNVIKSLEEVSGLVDKQTEELEKNLMHMQEQFQALFEEATELNAQISELIT